MKIGSEEAFFFTLGKFHELPIGDFKNRKCE
jgi:hypothetical protein